MAKLFYDKDIDESSLVDKTIAVLGFGSQGHAHALNLKESGFNVIVGLYEGSKSKEKAESAGLSVYSNSDATKKADLISFCLPDTVQAKVYKDEVEPNLSPGNILLFAHGFTIFYDQISPPDDVDVVMIAPKAPGHRVRAVYERGLGVPCLIAVDKDFSGNAHSIALAYGKGVGGGRAGILETTFKEETETDLFGEQAVLCGGVSELVKTAFDVLVEGGYEPESAYFEVLHELKLIVDLMYQGGLEHMRYSISETAEYGDYSRGPVVIDENVKKNMQKVLEQIQSGEFAREWIAENDEGLHRFKQMREQNKEHGVEKVGKELRSMMPWLESTT
ncbi:MAG: ketol-acid reductoisomerase [Dehalococcoidia bacterium]|nr:ketol-acid reductoisomerase [Dehalococcoidia bacterium]MQG09456.1 ketol-acid reductoisomerase [SAR202 cluster bacterium]|tara:strand:+ start:3270 stop:4268 length:999 start_codon:yes stop_codon:yes gene_type:complete